MEPIYLNIYEVMNMVGVIIDGDMIDDYELRADVMNQWETIKIFQHSHDLDEQWSTEKVIFKHLPTEEYFRTFITYTSDNGYDLDDSLSWEIVSPFPKIDYLTIPEIQQHSRLNNVK